MGEKRGGKFQELNNFAAVNDTTKRKRLKYHEIRSLPPDSKASEYGFDECRHCSELGLDSDHIFYDCKKNPKWKPFSPKKEHKGDQRNLQRNLITNPNKKDEEVMSKEEIMAKIEMAYEMGKGAQEANSVANKTEMSNFMRSLSTQDTADTQDYRRKATLFRNMNFASPKSRKYATGVPRYIRQRVQAILDTGSSGNDMPAWLASEIGCREIENPLRKIPINTVLGNIFVTLSR